MCKGGVCFVLAEVLHGVYFPHVALADFETAWEVTLSNTMYLLEAEDEAAFIRYYSLPVKSLSCKKLVDLQHFKTFLPQLVELLPQKTLEEVSDAQCSPAGGVVNNSYLTELLRKPSAPLSLDPQSTVISRTNADSAPTEGSTDNANVSSKCPQLDNSLSDILNER